MAKYLISTTETYRIDTEEEAVNFINEVKKNNTYILNKYSNEHKEKMQRGELIDEYFKVVLTKGFNDIKEPISEVEVHYEVK